MKGVGYICGLSVVGECERRDERLTGWHVCVMELETLDERIRQLQDTKDTCFWNTQRADRVEGTEEGNRYVGVRIV